jgi:AbiV family abortive infection protein
MKPEGVLMKPKKHPVPRYEGQLTPSQVAAAINTANANARRLLRDAELMLISRRLPSAAALAILAIEETGKDWILRANTLARTDGERTEFWREFYNHKSKNAEWVLSSFEALLQPTTARDYLPVYDEDAPHRILLDQLKQQSLYTAFSPKGDPVHPESVVDEGVAGALVQIARDLVTRRRDVRPEEIDLMIKHVAPVWKTTPKLIREGFAAFFKEAAAKGYILADEARIDEFLGG